MKALDVRFRRQILPSHASHIRHAEFLDDDYYTSTEGLLDCLVVASSLPNLESLTLDMEAIMPRATGDFWNAILDQSEKSIALRVTLRRIKSLALMSDRNTQECLAILRHANPSLVSLEFTWPRANEHEHISEMLETLQRFDSLRTLRIRNGPDISLAAHTLPRWPLQELSFDVPHDTEAEVCCCELVDFFAPFLRTLTIAFALETSSSELPLFSVPLPNLRELTVSGAPERYLATAPSLTPALRHLTLGVEDVNEQYQIGVLLATHVQHLPAIACVEFSPSEDGELVPTRTLDVVSRMLGISRGRRQFDPLLASASLVALALQSREFVGDEVYVRDRVAAIEEVIKFGLAHIKALERTRDVPAIALFIESLQPLKMYKDFVED
ncbi:hypothetical protein JCM11491_006736 [Sporobolomyces phaffii]